MRANSQQSWEETNQADLAAAIHELRASLEEPAVAQDHASGNEDATKSGQEQTASAAPPTLEHLGALFSLSDFERQVVLLCAGVELDSDFAAAVARRGGTAGGQPTFGLALALLENAHWSALSPRAPLRRWRLIDVGTGSSLINAPLSLDERILHFLAGVHGADERLTGLLAPVSTEVSLPDSHRAVAGEITAYWGGRETDEPWPVIELLGADDEAMRAIAVTALRQLSIGAATLQATDIPDGAAQRDALSILVQREAALAHVAILIEFDTASDRNSAATAAFVDSLNAPVVLIGREPRQLETRTPMFRLAVGPLPEDEQRVLWHLALGDIADQLNGELNQVLQQFHLDTRRIRVSGAQVRAAAQHCENLDGLLWRICRSQARARLDDLGLRIRPRASWSELVLPEQPTRILHEIALHMRQRGRVYEDWGFEKTCSRGLGISALFAGPSGTGKTMAAEVLANDLKLDLYRIDLSQVVSKYIGETEKNLRRVFDAAEAAGAILLFDEADALFGKRSEVRDSHDRYANIEVSYLLQRMEEYRGIAILTTNLKDALDRAFLRRIRFVVAFPFPDARQRAHIWQGVFPPETPTRGLDAQRLAQLNVTGGNIRNIAMNAAFLAADRNEPVQITDVLRAAHDEYGKLDKTMSERETRGWT